MQYIQSKKASDRRRRTGPNFRPVGPEPLDMYMNSRQIYPPFFSFVNLPHGKKKGKKESAASARARRLSPPPPAPTASPRLPIAAPPRCRLDASRRAAVGIAARLPAKIQLLPFATLRRLVPTWGWWLQHPPPSPSLFAADVGFHHRVHKKKASTTKKGFRWW